jgi:putative NIF3 family GTP cyclohydrolase 1 type 2
MINLQNRQPFFEYDGVKIGFSGELDGENTLGEIAAALGEALEVEPLLRGDANAVIRRTAIVSGGGGLDAVFAAAAAGCQLLITGEMEHIMHHPARELGVSIIALGHYASETTGVLAMQKMIAENCPVETVFAEVPTGL